MAGIAGAGTSEEVTNSTKCWSEVMAGIKEGERKVCMPYLVTAGKGGLGLGFKPGNKTLGKT